MLSCRIPECYSSELLQEINGNVLRERVGGSLFFLESAVYQGCCKWSQRMVWEEINSM